MKLYPHQETGVEWLAKTTRGGLFDEQGLGKTATAICAADKIGAKRILVLAPVAVAHNWKKEIQRWSPSSTVQIIRTGSDVVRLDVRYVICTHALLLNQQLFGQLVKQRWDLAVLDEAHFFKNATAQRTKRFYPLSAQVNKPSIASVCDRIWVMTGTPMPNNPTELWTMLYGLAPGRLLPGHQPRGRPMSFFQFRARFCQLESVRGAPPGVMKIVGVKNTAELKQRLDGFALRRLKKDHLNLPAMRWGTVSLSGIELPAELKELEQQSVSDWQRGTDDILDTLRDSVAFSTWRRLCGIAKAPAAADLIESELEGSTHKVVVFAHHTEVLDTLCQRLAPFGVVRISGETSAVERQRAVDAFQRDDHAVRVAVCNIVAGGIGITLTAAHDVVFVESSFVPGENAQAADRCHRIGQKESVLVRVLSLAGSVDEVVADIVARKAQMIREVLT